MTKTIFKPSWSANHRHNPVMNKTETEREGDDVQGEDRKIETAHISIQNNCDTNFLLYVGIMYSGREKGLQTHHDILHLQHSK